MSGITKDNRKHILEALKNERNDILKLLKQKSNGSVKRPSTEKQQEQQIIIQDQIKPENDDLFQQQNLYNQMPSNSNSKRNSISMEEDQQSQGSAQKKNQESDPSNYNYTFNKFNNKVLLEQMKLEYEQVEQNQRYLYGDMLEQDEEQEVDEDDELDQVNQQNNNSQSQNRYHYQNYNDGHSEQNGQHSQYEQSENSNNFQQSQLSGQSYNINSQQQYNNSDGFQRDNEYFDQHQHTFQNKNNGSQKRQPPKEQQQKYFISDKPVKNQQSLKANKSQQEFTYHNHQQKQNQEHLTTAKNAVKDIKSKLLSLKQEKEQREKDLIKKRIEEYDKKKSEHSFHPQCKISNEQEIQRNTIHKDPLTEEQRCSAWLRLYDDKKQFYQENEEERKRIEVTKIEDNCYTTPEINVLSRKLAENKNKENNLPVEDRLNLEAKKYKIKQQIQYQEQQLKEVQDLTFKPQIYSQPLQNQPPIYERFTEIAKKKQEIIHQLKMKEQSTFQPEINPKSAEIAEHKINNKNVSERLNHEYAEQQKRKEKLQSQVQEEVYKECRFHPSTNPSSSEIVKSLPLYDGRADVVERQQVLEKQSRDKKLRVAQELENNQCSFKPQINQISEILVIENQGRLLETNQQKIDRMYKHEVEMRKMKTEMRQKEYDSQNTFTPSINEVSKYIVSDRTRDLDELAYNYTGKMHLKLLQEEKEFEQMKECSFYPSTTQSVKYMHVPAYYNQEKAYKSVKMETQIKEKRLREQKKQYINKELSECTFKPAINKDKKIDKKSNIDKIKGLENFLVNKDKAERQKCERLQKEDEIFNIHKKYDTENREKFTTPQPFKLSHYNKQPQPI